MEYKEAEKLLQTFSLEELLEENDLTEADVLYFLVLHNKISLPEIRPLDFDDTPT